MSDEYSSWAVGWTAFAATMLIIGGIFEVMAGIVAIANEKFYVIGTDYVFELNVATWGWIHLGLGILVAVAGISLFSGHILGRTVGVIAAIMTALTNFAWLPYYPVWSVLMIAIAFLVIWSLTVHGDDIARN